MLNQKLFLIGLETQFPEICLTIENSKKEHERLHRSGVPAKTVPLQATDMHLQLSMFNLSLR